MVEQQSTQFVKGCWSLSKRTWLTLYYIIIDWLSLMICITCCLYLRLWYCSPNNFHDLAWHSDYSSFESSKFIWMDHLAIKGWGCKCPLGLFTCTQRDHVTTDHEVIPRPYKFCDWLLSLSQDHFGLHQGKECPGDHGVQGVPKTHFKAYIIQRVLQLRRQRGDTSRRK